MTYVPVVIGNITSTFKIQKERTAMRMFVLTVLWYDVNKEQASRPHLSDAPSQGACLCCQARGFGPSWHLLVFHFSHLPSIRRSVLHLLYQPHTFWPLSLKYRDSNIHNHLESSAISSLPRTFPICTDYPNLYLLPSLASIISPSAFTPYIDHFIQPPLSSRGYSIKSLVVVNTAP